MSSGFLTLQSGGRGSDWLITVAGKANEIMSSFKAVDLREPNSHSRAWGRVEARPSGVSLERCGRASQAP